MISVCHKGVTLLLVCGLCLLPTGVLADTQYLTDDEGVPVGDTIIVPEPDLTWEETTKTVAAVTAAVVVATLLVWAEPYVAKLLCGTGPAVAQPRPAVAQPRPAVAQPGSAVAQPGSAVAQPGSAVAQPGSAVQKISPENMLQLKNMLEKDLLNIPDTGFGRPFALPEGMRNVPNAPRGTVNNPATIRNTGGINPGAMEEYPRGGGQMINRGGGGTATVLENPQQIQIWTPNEILARQAIDDILAVNPRGLDGVIRIVHHAPPEIAAALPIPLPNLGAAERFVPIGRFQIPQPATQDNRELGGTYAALLNVIPGPPLQRTVRLVPGAEFREENRLDFPIPEVPIPPEVEVIVDNTTLRILGFQIPANRYDTPAVADFFEAMARTRVIITNGYMEQARAGVDYMEIFDQVNLTATNIRELDVRPNATILGYGLQSGLQQNQTIYFFARWEAFQLDRARAEIERQRGVWEQERRAIGNLPNETADAYDLLPEELAFLVHRRFMWVQDMNAAFTLGEELIGTQLQLLELNYRRRVAFAMGDVRGVRHPWEELTNPGQLNAVRAQREAYERLRVQLRQETETLLAELAHWNAHGDLAPVQLQARYHKSRYRPRDMSANVSANVSANDMRAEAYLSPLEEFGRGYDDDRGAPPGSQGLMVEEGTDEAGSDGGGMAAGSAARDAEWALKIQRLDLLLAQQKELIREEGEALERVAREESQAAREDSHQMTVAAAELQRRAEELEQGGQAAESAEVTEQRELAEGFTALAQEFETNAVALEQLAQECHDLYDAVDVDPIVDRMSAPRPLPLTSRDASPQVPLVEGPEVPVDEAVAGMADSDSALFEDEAVAEQFDQVAQDRAREAARAQAIEVIVQEYRKQTTSEIDRMRETARDLDDEVKTSLAIGRDSDYQSSSSNLAVIQLMEQQGKILAQQADAREGIIQAGGYAIPVQTSFLTDKAQECQKLAHRARHPHNQSVQAHLEEVLQQNTAQTDPLRKLVDLRATTIERSIQLQQTLAQQDADSIGNWAQILVQSQDSAISLQVSELERLAQERREEAQALGQFTRALNPLLANSPTPAESTPTPA